MATAPTDSATKTPPAPSASGPIVVDLGKKRRKQIRQAREGRGKLIDEMQTVLDDLRANGTLAANAQPVLMIVRQRRRRSSRKLFFS